MINLNNKVFKTMSNTGTGEVDEATRFYYYQENGIISAHYHGGKIKQGHLLGKQLQNDSFEFYYHHVNSDGKLKVGRCLSKGFIQSDGKIMLKESWEWLCDDMSKGQSTLLEV